MHAFTSVSSSIVKVFEVIFGNFCSLNTSYEKRRKKKVGTKESKCSNDPYSPY